MRFQYGINCRAQSRVRFYSNRSSPRETRVLSAASVVRLVQIILCSAEPNACVSPLSYSFEYNLIGDFQVMVWVFLLIWDLIWRISWEIARSKNNFSFEENESKIPYESFKENSNFNPSLSIKESARTLNILAILGTGKGEHVEINCHHARSWSVQYSSTGAGTVVVVVLSPP